MNVLMRNRREIYYCELYNEDGIEKFKKPIPVKINFEPTNSSSQIFAFGNVYPLFLKGIVLNSLDIKFKSGDKCYIYNKLPEEYDELCSDADYIVENEPLQTLNFKEVRFKRLTSDMTYE